MMGSFCGYFVRPTSLGNKESGVDLSETWDIVGVSTIQVAVSRVFIIIPTGVESPTKRLFPCVFPHMHDIPSGLNVLLFFVGQHITILKSLHFGKLIQPPYQKYCQHSKQELQRVADPGIVDNIFVFDDSLNVLRFGSEVFDKIDHQEVHQEEVHYDIKLV
jgi:hypothetical protein